MRALITGCGGFIGSHLRNELEANGYDVIPAAHAEETGMIAMDILDRDRIRSVLAQYQPDTLIHLAGQANVGLSWREPQRTLELNVTGLLNILEAVREVKPTIRIIAVGSADEYGNLKENGVNVTEETPLNPVTPYGISKQAQEQFARLYAKAFGMDICMIRMFNLGGAGQKKGYMIADFCSGIAEIEAGKRAQMSVGNLTSARDFTHVKDACRAARLIVERGHSGEVYNVCSGTTHTAQEVLDKLLGMAKADVVVVWDPARMRPSDTPVVCGNHDKLTAHTGWTPELGIDAILSDALHDWRNRR